MMAKALEARTWRQNIQLEIVNKSSTENEII